MRVGTRIAIGAALVLLAGFGPAVGSTGPLLAQLDPGPRLAARCAPGQRGSATPVPILMYHVIAAPPPDAPYPNLFVPPRRFAAQIALLARHGYHGVTLGRVWAHWRRCVPLPSKPVVVSFDDGFLSWYRVAYPVLRRHGWLGTMNLALSHLNGIDVRRAWLRNLIGAGWELDSHSLTHLDLTLLGPDALRREVAGSRRRLRRLFGVPVHFFCYPAGRYNDRVLAAVRTAGYFGATTTADGLARPQRPYALARVRVNGDDSPGGVLAHIRSAG
jgi:peptidoglycan/xylan/chitin deacetylase (PgdA/CDA1 family)